MGFKLTYSSTKFIKVDNTFLVVLYYTTQVVLLAYVVVYQIWYKGGYQKTSPFEGAVDIKVKGSGFLGDVDDCPAPGWDWPRCGPYDTGDTSLPPQQEGAVFVTTSFYSTPAQTRGVCASRAKCTADADCPKGMAGSGSSASFLTGRCNATAQRCDAAAWCPPEVPSKELNAAKRNLTDTGNFTVFFRVDGSFSAFDDKIFSTGDALVYNYNLFYLSDLVAYSQGVDTYPLKNVSAGEVPDPVTGRPSPSSFLSTVGDGTVIFLSATIMANGSSVDNPFPCDLDYEDPNCAIIFSFVRVDPPSASSASHGYNFRYTSPWSMAENGTRSLTKLYGTRIVFQVIGEGAQFDLMTLTVSVGSGIGMLSLAKILCDYILLFICMRRHPQYRRKYEDVPEDGVDSTGGGSGAGGNYNHNYDATTHSSIDVGEHSHADLSLTDPLFPHQAARASLPNTARPEQQ